MVVNYNGLWKMLIDNKIKKKDLYSELNIGIGTIAKTGKGELVSLEILIKYVMHLNIKIRIYIIIKSM